MTSEFKSNQDLYDFIASLREYLSEISEFEWAERLHTALFISSSVTEVFLSLRKELEGLLNSSVKLSPPFENGVRMSIEAIGLAFL